MRVVVVMVASRQNEEFQRTVDSLRTFNLDFKIYGQGESFSFLKKLKCAAKAAEELVEYTHILFVDAFDVLFIGNEVQIEERVKQLGNHDFICSTEKACWPNPELDSQYPLLSSSPWCYLNSGSYIARREYLVDLFRKEEVQGLEEPFDDQLWLTQLYLKDPEKVIKLDTQCVLFQSVAFLAEGEFLTEGKFKNNVTGEHPIILHGNGHTDLSPYLHLVKR